MLKNSLSLLTTDRLLSKWDLSTDFFDDRFQATGRAMAGNGAKIPISSASFGFLRCFFLNLAFIKQN
jgi:hypothetical protein